MASPQIENGYLRIAIEFWEVLCKVNIPGTERQILDFIIRKTWGFKKKEDRISNTQFCKGTGLHKVTICRAINKLITKNIVSKLVNTNPPTYSIQKDYSTWNVLTHRLTVNQNVNSEIKISIKNGHLDDIVNQNVNSEIVNQNANAVNQNANAIITKDTYTKDTYTKDTIPSLKRRARLPKDFSLKESLKEYAISKRIDPEKVDELFDSFRDYHESHGTVMLDWDKAWCTFVRNAPKFSEWAVIDESKSKFGF